MQFQLNSSSDVEDNTSGPCNINGMADLLLLRIPLAICRNSETPCFFETIYSSVLLVYTTLAASRTFLQQLLTCLSLFLDT